MSFIKRMLDLPTIDWASLDSLEDRRIISSSELFKFRRKHIVKRLFSPLQKRKVYNNFFNLLLDQLANRYEVESPERMKRLWNYTMAMNHDITWEKTQTLTVGILKQINNAFYDAIVYEGVGIDFEMPENKTGTHPVLDQAIEKFLSRRDAIDIKILLTFRNLKGLLISKDQEMLDTFQQKIQDALLASFNAIEDVTFEDDDENQELIFNALVHQLIAYIPFTYPQMGSTFQFPVKTDNGWEMTDYTVDKVIKMTPSWFTSPIQGFCFLPSDADSNAPALYVPPPTPLPSGEGFWAGYMGNFIPFCSTGAVAAYMGKEELDDWLSNKDNVNLIGLSLGGTLGLHAYRDFPDKFKQMHLFNPPGLYSCNFEKNSSSQTEINIYLNNNDLISTLGLFPEHDNVKVYRVFGDKKENLFDSHPRIYAGGSRVTFLKSSAAYENQRSATRLLTAGHMFIFSPLAFLIFLPLGLTYSLFDHLFAAIDSAFTSNTPLSQEVTTV